MLQDIAPGCVVLAWGGPYQRREWLVVFHFQKQRIKKKDRK
jgi:hypothetical protein